MLPPQRQYWTAFRNPSQSNATGLYLLQPYQPGRVPLVLIHGLASDALTWDETVAALNANPEITARYQIWLYQYPTGLSYLRTAAELRKELLGIRSLLDPANNDPAFEQTVLVGHSMGGVVAKLQVSYSDDHLWRAISDVPLDEALNSGPISDDAVASVLFQPVSFVKKVVYIATPHQGSNWTQRPLGRIGSWLVNIPDTVEQEYARLTRNPGARPPTSLDLLIPGNNIIRATNSLRYADGVATHSIIGTGYRSPDGFMGDGIVAIVSAHRSEVRTEYFVKATHSGILKNSAAAAELTCILTH
ncbi:MAG: alpha/beta hydrolase [Planctomycetota bacterium]|nr:MAG: alpha/beta hydrolase [Planctomycetota bacterium]